MGEKPPRARTVALRTQCEQRLVTSCGIDRYCGEEFAQLPRRAAIETAEGPIRKPRNLAEGALGTCILALLEKEDRHP